MSETKAGLANQQVDDRVTGEWFRRLVEHAPDAICVLRDERLLYANAAAVRWMAAQSGDQLVGRHITDIVDPDAIPQMRAGATALKEIGDASVAFEAQMLRVDGSTLSVEAVSVLTLWEREPAYLVVFHDVSARKAAREQDFEAIVQMLDEGVIVMRGDGYLKFINPAAMQIYDLGSERAAADFVLQAATSPCYAADGKRVPPELHPAGLAFRTGVSFEKEIYGMDLPNGERRWLLTSGRLLNPDDPASDVLVSFSDITAQREDLDRLVYQANHDLLTGLPNRAFVLRRITDALADTDCGRLRAVLFIDLDDLKTTNDTLGHQAGDDLLNAAAARLRQAVGPDDVVGRHGGDEFVVLIFGAATRKELDRMVGRLRGLLAEPVVIAATTFPIRASVGIVEVDRDDQRDAEEILRDADRAMYKAKRAGRQDR